MKEWIDSIRQELEKEQQENPQQPPTPKKKERYKREFKYMEVDTAQGRGIPTVKKWAIQQALRRYKEIEKKRYKTIEYIEPPKNEQVEDGGKDRKLCGEISCLIM